MTDDQMIVLAAAVMQNFIEDPEEALIRARQLFYKHQEMGPLCPPSKIQKATLSKPSVEDWNESHEARQYEKRRGT